MQIKYINLDDDFDKNQRMQSMLKKFGLDKLSQRFPGVKSTFSFNGLSKSETGCLLAHLSVLKSLSQHQTSIILEDDVKLTEDFNIKILKLVEKLESSKMDLIFLGQTVLPQDITTHRKLFKYYDISKNNNNYHVLDASIFYRFGAFAYAINGNSLHKIKNLINTLDFSLNAKAFDVLLGFWIKNRLLTAGLIVPYFAGVDSKLSSTMFDRENPLRHLRYAELANLYCSDYTNNALGDWHKILANHPNQRALDICRALYLSLTDE
jgi:GR25 family glycosyltransferase involved in LPS biosynthesis